MGGFEDGVGMAQLRNVKSWVDQEERVAWTPGDSAMLSDSAKMK